MLAGTPAFSRSLSLSHQLVEGRFGFGEETRVLRVAHRKGALLFGSEEVFGAAWSIGHGNRW